MTPECITAPTRVVEKIGETECATTLVVDLPIDTDSMVAPARWGAIGPDSDSGVANY